MKRSAIARRKPLRRKKPIKATRSAEDIAQQPSTCTGGKTKPKRKKTSGLNAGMGQARRVVYARSEGVCEVRLPGICLGVAGSWHHRKNKSQGGRWLPSNGLHTCGDGTTGCHGALTNPNGRRAEYERHGWIVPRAGDPATTRVLLTGPDGSRGYYLLDDRGGLMSTDTHDCPGGCGRQVSRQLFACRLCWFRLPLDLRKPILIHHGKDLGAHGQAMADARRWYQAHQNGGAR